MITTTKQQSFVDSPYLMTKNNRVGLIGFNKMLRILDISSKVPDTYIEDKLSKILTIDPNFNGFIWKAFRYEDRAEIFCYISSEYCNSFPETFYEHYSRLHIELVVFAPKTQEEVLDEIKSIHRIIVSRGLKTFYYDNGRLVPHR